MKTLHCSFIELREISCFQMKSESWSSIHLLRKSLEFDLLFHFTNSNNKINCFFKKNVILLNWEKFPVFKWKVSHGHQLICSEKVWNLTSLSFKQQKKLCVFFKSFRHICQDQQVWQCMITDFRDAQYKSTHYHVFPLSKIRSKGEPLLSLFTLRDHSYIT